MKRRDLLILSAATASSPLLLKSAATAQTPPSAEMVTLASDLNGYYARSASQGTSPGVLVLMEAFGLNDYVKSICDRLAQAGYAALAPDFYHGDTYDYTDRTNAIARLRQLNDDTVMSEFGKGLEFLSGQPEVSEKIGTIGFCMGGRYAFLASAAHANATKAAVCFYGGGIAAGADPLGRASLLDRVESIQSPVLLIYGADDESIAPDEHERIALALSTQKKRYTLSVFPNAGHGFFSDRRDSYVPAVAQEAWDMTLAFFERNLA
jgi:carboxymethylenebutenolidase